MNTKRDELFNTNEFILDTYKQQVITMLVTYIYSLPVLRLSRVDSKYFK